MAQQLLERLTSAYALAAKAHSAQRRRGADASPYINHPCAVAEIVAASGGDEDTVIAAVLHDVVEDTPVTLTEIEARFGARVAAIVAGLTDSEEIDALPFARRKVAQAAKIATATPEVRLVKLADQISNVEDIAAEPGTDPKPRRRAYLAGASQVAAACAGVAPELDAQFSRAAAALEASCDAMEAQAG